MESQHQDAPDSIELVLDVENDTGLLWLDNYGEVVNGEDGHEAVVIETLAGREKCEDCREESLCYTLDGHRASVPVCRDCLGGYEWVTEIRES